MPLVQEGWLTSFSMYRWFLGRFLKSIHFPTLRLVHDVWHRGAWTLLYKCATSAPLLRALSDSPSPVPQQFSRSHPNLGLAVQTDAHFSKSHLRIDFDRQYAAKADS